MRGRLQQKMVDADLEEEAAAAWKEARGRVATDGREDIRRDEQQGVWLLHTIVRTYPASFQHENFFLRGQSLL